MKQSLPTLVLMSWGDIALVLALNSAVVLLVGRLLFDDQVRKSLARSKDNVLAMLNEWNRERNAKIDDAIALVDAHEDRMTAFEESLLRQGDTLNRTIDEHHKRQSEALETISDTLVEIQKEARQTALAVARMEGAQDRKSLTTT